MLPFVGRDDSARPLAPSLRELPPQAAEGVFLFRTKTGDADSSALRPQNDVGGRSMLPFVGRDDSAHPLAPSLRELPPQAAEGVFLFRTKTRATDSSALRPQNDVGERSVLPFVGRDDSARPLRGRQNPFLFPCRKKKRFLKSKEKGAFESWGAVRCPAAACVFTPPSGTGPGRYGLCGRNREKRAFYLSAAWAGAGRGVGPRAAIGRPPLNPPRSTGRWPGGAAGERRLRPNWGPGRRRWRRCRRRPAFPAPPGRWCCPCCGRR